MSCATIELHFQQIEAETATKSRKKYLKIQRQEIGHCNFMYRARFCVGQYWFKLR